MRALLLPIAHETSGAARIRHSLRPLTWRGRKNYQQTSGAMRREIAKVYPPSLRANGSRECAPDDRLREAIHSSLRGAMDCFAALAMTADTVSPSRDALRPRFAGILTPSSIQRAQGMPDARCTRGLMRSVHKECAHEHTGQRRTSDIPCARENK